VGENACHGSLAWLQVVKRLTVKFDLLPSHNRAAPQHPYLMLRSRASLCAL
jgi:hypothetical protein